MKEYIIKVLDKYFKGEYKITGESETNMKIKFLLKLNGVNNRDMEKDLDPYCYISEIGRWKFRANHYMVVKFRKEGDLKYMCN